MSDQPPNTERAKRRYSRRQLLLAGSAGLLAGGAAVKLGSAISDGAGVRPKGFSRARPIVTDTVLPKKVDVAIIGGGFAGTSTALALAERGVSVALFEKGVIAGEASGRAGGLIEAQFEDPEKLELIEYSKQRWRKMREITGEENGLVEKGSSLLFESQELLDFAKAWVDGTKGLPNGGARILSAAEATALAPGARARVIGGITTTTDAAAESELAVPGFALGARKLGAKIYQHCAVRGIERSAGRVSAVITESGRVEASSVVIAGGIWSSMLAEDLGLKIPMIQCFAKAMTLWPFDGPDYGTTTIVGKTGLGWRKQFGGGYLIWEFLGVGPILPTSVRHFFDLIPAFEENAAALEPRLDLKTFWRWRSQGPIPLDRPGPFEETRIYEPKLNNDLVDLGLTHLQAVMPVFERTSVRERWTGAMPMTSDNMPVISGVDSVPGLFVGTGFMYGLTMGPGTGLVLADLVTGKKPAIDVKPFRLSRFMDGTKLHYHG